MSLFVFVIVCIVCLFVCIVCFHCRVLENGHKTTRTVTGSEKQKPHCVISITIELRPKYEQHSKNTYSGFMLPRSEVRGYTL